MELESLKLVVETLVQPVNGLIGVCVHDISSGEQVGFRMDEPLPMASVCKIPILVTAYRQSEAGELDLLERIEFTEERRCFGSGLFNAFTPGCQLTIHDLLLMMIVVSDNAATDMVLEKLGRGAVKRTMAELGLLEIHPERSIADLLSDFLIALEPALSGMKWGEWDDYCDRNPGLREKSMDLNVIREAVNASASHRDTATVRAMARLCALIAQNQCASQDSCEAMLEIMDRQVLNTRLPRQLPQFTRLPHKTGTLGSGAVVNDAGILYIDDVARAAVVVLSRDVRNPLFETEEIIGQIGRAVYDHYKQ